MLSIPKTPVKSMHMTKTRSSESIGKELAQNSKLLALGIDPYEYDTEIEYTEEEQNIINEAIKLIILDQEVPEALEQQVRQITKKTAAAP